MSVRGTQSTQSMRCWWRQRPLIGREPPAEDTPTSKRETLETSRHRHRGVSPGNTPPRASQWQRKASTRAREDTSIPEDTPLSDGSLARRPPSPHHALTNTPSQVPHHHGAPDFHGHDGLLPHHATAARASPAEHAQVRSHRYGPLTRPARHARKRSAETRTVRKQVLFLEAKRGKNR